MRSLRAAVARRYPGHAQRRNDRLWILREAEPSFIGNEGPISLLENAEGEDYSCIL
jgi:hypothetical protein